MNTLRRRLEVVDTKMLGKNGLRSVDHLISWVTKHWLGPSWGCRLVVGGTETQSNLRVGTYRRDYPMYGG